ncbi:MAG: universal stress protein [Thermomicrobiales bacterium]
MIDRIVVPLDRSAQSEMAIPYATMLAGIFDARVMYLYVVPEQEDLEIGSADQYLTEIGERFSTGTGYRTAVRMGSAAEAILDAAHDPGTMIVMATHGRGGLQRMLIGSVADAVVRKATVPVALINVGGELVPLTEPFHHILVPLDGSQRSESALPLALELARRCRAHVHLLQVVVPVSVGDIGYASDTSYLGPDAYAILMDDLERAAYDDLKSAVGDCERAGVPVSTHVRVGTPGDAIPRVAHDVIADLIVMATRGRGGARRMVLGSIATGLIQHSDLPLIVVPAGARLAIGGDDDACDARDLHVTLKVSNRE